MLGTYFRKSGDLIEARRVLSLANYYLRGLESFQFESEVYNEIGNSYFLSGDGRLAIEAYLLSIDVGEGAQDETSFYNGMLGAGKAFCMAGDTTEGLLYVHRFIDLAFNDDKYEALADAYAFLGMVQMEMGEVQEGMWSYKESLRCSLMSGSKLHAAHSYNNRAILDYQNGEMDSSLFHFKKALCLREEVGNNKAIVESHFNLANYYFGNDINELAIEQLKLSENLSRKYGFMQDEFDAIELVNEFGEELYKVERLGWLRHELKLKNDLSVELKAVAHEVLKTAKYTPAFVSQRESGSVLNWVIVSLCSALFSLFLVLVQKKLIN